ncbi:MAG: D-alanine--D-alanine ligase family protein [Bdellovibrionota bacterium]
MSPKKLKVMVLYGGRSGEHEISLRSAASVIRNLDPAKYEVVPVSIDKQGRWRLNDITLIQNQKLDALPMFKDAPTVVLPPNPAGGDTRLMPFGRADNGSARHVDVVFPVMHGPLCEDGTIQGLLELADVPYVGPGVLASAVGMDKDVAKRLIREAGLPIVPFVSLRHETWLKNVESTSARIARELRFPCFVKPANMGSSVGVHKVKEPGALSGALKDAFKYDTKVLVERAVNAREIEFAVLENPDVGAPPLVSKPGEVIPTHEFYSYESKYIDENGAALQIPAKLSAEQAAEGTRIAREAFMTLECEGMTRVDLFLDKDSGHFYFNEVNTIPGFTSISMYPKMWEASGISYTELLSRLIELAIARHGRKAKLSREFVAD